MRRKNEEIMISKKGVPVPIHQLLGPIKTTKSVVKAAKRHVMISYQWDRQRLASVIERKLSAAGYTTWYDLNNMRGGVNESMADAVENSAVVLVDQYKMNANCKKECEYAEKCSKPIVWIVVQQDFSANAWLGLLMGDSLYYAAWDDPLLESNWCAIQNRIEDFC
jgi:hypothetical protein